MALTVKSRRDKSSCNWRVKETLAGCRASRYSPSARWVVISMGLPSESTVTVPCAMPVGMTRNSPRQACISSGVASVVRSKSCGEVPRSKPAPDIYLHGAATIGVAPENCLAIEDSPAGIEAAWRAGCMAVIVPDQDQPDELTLSRSFARADSLFDVMELV